MVIQCLRTWGRPQYMHGNFERANRMKINNAFLRDWIKELRLFQWIKNVLIFVPLVTSHKFFNIDTLRLTVAAFFLFSLCASSIYVINDVLDCESDRRHLTKCKRPIAAGRIAVRTATKVSLFILLTTFTLCGLIFPKIFPVLLSYTALALSYSLFLKRLVILDVVMLAIFYIFRIIVGGISAEINLSIWLLGFSTFFFLSLAFSKRYSEISLADSKDVDVNSRRGYKKEDLQVLLILGIGAGFSSLTVFMIYLNDTTTRLMYSNAERLFFLVPIFVYWIAVNWIEVGRHEAGDDPVSDLIQDKKMLILLPVVILIVVFAI
jgi:4-hydroxybenzoate polyprenyltransferase